MRGRLSIDGRHGNRLRCIVYFSANTYLCSCCAVCLKQIVESNVPES